MNCEFQMEQSFTIDGLPPEFIFGGLKGEIIDYIISSYQVNMKLIQLYYYHPALQIHCQELIQPSGKETNVHLHKIKSPGIYHAKFILITTTEILKFIIMTTNITEICIKNCLNDYYVITIPRTKLSSPTPFTSLLYQFLDSFDIKLKSPLLMYRWKGIQGKLLISIPGKMSHAICFQNQIEKPKSSMKREAIIRCSSMMCGYNIKKVFHVKRCVVEPMKEKEGIPLLGIYDLNNNKEQDGKTLRYEIQPFEAKEAFHYKRYIIRYIDVKKKEPIQYLIITSANLTRQAWGTQKYAAYNAELGIIWNSKFTFN